jgi:hypothetical protein
MYRTMLKSKILRATVTMGKGSVTSRRRKG